MSTATQVFGFMGTEAAELPRLACIGYVEKVEGKTTQKGVYDMQTVHITPAESGKKTVTNFMYEPSWLVPGFNPKTLLEEAGGSTKYFLFGKNIKSQVEGSVSVLQGLAGSEEGFDSLSYSILTADDQSPEGIQNILATYFNENNPAIGYILQQRRRKTEEKDERGKAIYVLEQGYEVGEFFYVTDEAKEKLARRAANGKLVLTFEV